MLSHLVLLSDVYSHDIAGVFHSFKLALILMHLGSQCSFVHQYQEDGYTAHGMNLNVID